MRCLADRDGQPAVVVELERVVVDLDLDHVVARFVEGLVEGDGDRLADRQVDRLLGAEPAVDHQPDADPPPGSGPKLWTVAWTSGRGPR